MAKEIKTRARSLESTLEGVEIKDPLVRRFPLHETPLSDHSDTVLDPSSGPYVGYRICRRQPTSKEKTGPESSAEEESPPPQPSSSVILTSLFGWSLVSSVLCNPYPSPRLLPLTCPGPPPSYPQRALLLPPYLYL
jgi:hypothetical protein